MSSNSSPPRGVRVSIVTVSYNSADTIADTLRTVAEQGYRNIEHIVVDGASSDGTAEIVTAAGAAVSRFVSEPDAGIYDAMNKGIRLATGDVVGFLNGDDFFASPRALQRVADAFEDPDVDVCYADLCYVRQNSPSKLVRYWRSEPFASGAFRRGWVPPHPTFFARRSVYERFGGFDLSYRIAADFEIMARFLEVHRLRSRYLPEVLVHMRTGGTTNRSLSNIVEQNREIWRALKSHGLNPSLPVFALSKLALRGRQFFVRPA